MRCRALPCRALPCGAIPCGAVPCWAVLRVSPYLIFRTWQASSEVSFQVLVLPQVCIYYLLRCSITKNALPAQLNPAIAKQRNAAPCGAVPCLALRCGVLPCCSAVLCCAFFRAYSTGNHAKYQVPVCTCILVVLLSSFDGPLSVLFMYFIFCFANYTTADQNVTSPKNTRHSTGQSARHE